VCDDDQGEETVQVTLDDDAVIAPGNEHRRKKGNADLTTLIAAAAAQDQRAWATLIRRFTPLVYSVVSRYRLSRNNADDVVQTVWMRALENLGSIREPKAFPGWIITISRHEALRVVTTDRFTDLIDPLSDSDRNDRDRSSVHTVEDVVLRAEQRRALRDGLNALQPEHRELLLLLHADPRVSYQEISMRLGIPKGSIGPTRARCLQKLRATTPVRTLLGAGSAR